VPPDPAQQERDRENGVERSGSKTKKNWSRGALHVLVKEARNLQTRNKNSGTCDPFCKRYSTELRISMFLCNQKTKDL